MADFRNILINSLKFIKYIHLIILSYKLFEQVTRVAISKRQIRPIEN